MANITLGDRTLEITDPHQIQPVCADLLTEIRHFNGLVAITFACTIAEGDGQPRAETTARIRLSVPVAAALRQGLEDILRDALPAKESMN